MNKMDGIQTKILDCTIRDGGYLNSWDFSFQAVKDIYQQLSRSGIDVVEIGFRDHADHDLIWRKCPENVLLQLKTPSHQAMLSVMVDFGKADVTDFCPAPESAVDMVRVAVHKNKIKEALKLINALKIKGYMTSLQLMGYPQYTDQERKNTILMLKDTALDYIYMADSYGTLFPDQVGELIEPLTAVENSQIGFHPHNNLQLAFANTIEAIKHGAQIVDTTLYGIGRGAGNLPTEALVALMQQYAPQKYNLTHVLFCVDMYMLPLQKQYKWGYQLPYMMSGFCECHPSYSKELVETRRYTVDEIWRALNEVKRLEPVGFDPNLLTQILDSGLFEYKTSPQNIKLNEINQETKLLETPPYLMRHRSQPFLVLANGPELKKNLKLINQFIEKYNPVILGANYLGDLLVPHYHAFVNKKRFAKYVHHVSDASQLLLNCHFQTEFIRQYTDRSYERLMFNTGDRDVFSIDDGVISNDCRSISMLLIGVAITMGDGDVFVAGMDGYVPTDTNDGFHFYAEFDDSDSPEYNLMRQKWGLNTLKLLDNYLKKNGRSGVNIVTPTSYDYYYRDINSLL